MRVIEGRYPTSIRVDRCTRVRVAFSRLDIERIRNFQSVYDVSTSLYYKEIIPGPCQRLTNY